MRILYNATIHTLDPQHPAASVLVIQGDCIWAAGGEELAAEFTSPQLENMEGRVILPGFTDAHLHLQELALFRSIIDCEVSSLVECLQRVGQQALRVKPGEWIRGHGWNQNEWGGKWPGAADLEAVAPGLPVYLTAKSLHAAWASRASLQLAGIDASTPDPKNGTILRDQHGEPTGILLEDAMKLVEKVIPAPNLRVLAETLQKDVIPALWRSGLTGVHDFDKRLCYQALQWLDANHALHLRVCKSIPMEFLKDAVGLGVRTGFGSDMLSIGNVKYFADGALGPHTGALLEPYLDDPQNRGMLILDAQQTFQIGVLASASGLALAIHAIGDRAVHEVLDGYEMLRAYEQEHALPALRHRIEHVQTIDPRDAGRFAKLGVIASMQPVHAPSDMDTTERFLGGRSAYCYAWRMLLDSGARLAFGSDAPVESFNPFIGLHAAVTRRRADGSPGPDGWHPEQRLSLDQALEAFTSGPAFAAGMESRLGRLAPGCLADLIVLDADPFNCSPDQLRELQPSATMVGGEWVWRK